jgi:hypothetical protein
MQKHYFIWQLSLSARLAYGISTVINHLNLRCDARRRAERNILPATSVVIVGKHVMRTVIYWTKS